MPKKSLGQIGAYRLGCTPPLRGQFSNFFFELGAEILAHGWGLRKNIPAKNLDSCDPPSCQEAPLLSGGVLKVRKRVIFVGFSFLIGPSFFHKNWCTDALGTEV